jgi:hypothetical protein
MGITRLLPQITSESCGCVGFGRTAFLTRTYSSAVYAPTAHFFLLVLESSQPTGNKKGHPQMGVLSRTVFQGSLAANL